jgi:hypothetical protein
MKKAHWLLVAATLAGCATYPSDRIASDQADFNSWPPAVQAQVREGRVAPGFTPEQVFVALGNPSEKTQAGVPGDLAEVWVYHKSAPRISIGIGGADFGGHGGVAGGVSAYGLKLGIDEDGRVIFHNGHVTEVEIMER